MEFKANFPYSTVSISTFQDSIYLIKRNYLRKVERTEDNFVMKIKGQTITSESIDDFRFQLAKAIGKGFFKIRLRKLSFTIKSIDWLVSFNGSDNGRMVSFVDVSKHQSARSKRDAFKKLWKEQIDLAYENAKSRKTIFVSMIVDQTDIFLTFAAIFGEIINIFTWQYLYSGNLPLYFPSLIFLIQIAYSIVPTIPLEFMLIRIDYWAERNEAVERLSRDKFSISGVLKGNFSLMLRLVLIPFIILIYNDSLFLSIFPTFPHAFLRTFLDIAPVYVVATILILLAGKIISRVIRGDGLNRARPIYKSGYFRKHWTY